MSSDGGNSRQLELRIEPESAEPPSLREPLLITMSLSDSISPPIRVF
jgi:hypothetical protein